MVQAAWVKEGGGDVAVVLPWLCWGQAVPPAWQPGEALMLTGASARSMLGECVRSALGPSDRRPWAAAERLIQADTR